MDNTNNNNKKSSYIYNENGDDYVLALYIEWLAMYVYI